MTKTEALVEILRMGYHIVINPYDYSLIINYPFDFDISNKIQITSAVVSGYIQVYLNTRWSEPLRIKTSLQLLKLKVFW